MDTVSKPTSVNPAYLTNPIGPTITAQQLFDFVAWHLLEQGAPSLRTVVDEADGRLGNITCAYRGQEGRMCAVGCLLRDDEYVPNMEGRSARGLKDHGKLPVRLYPHIDLLMRLQILHDSGRRLAPTLVRSLWTQGLRDLARREGLDTSVLDTWLAGHPADVPGEAS